MKVSVALNVLDSPASFWSQSYGAASIVFGITLFELAALAGRPNEFFLPLGLISFGISMLLRFSRTSSMRCLAKASALMAFAMMLASSAPTGSESELPWISFTSVLCVGTAIANSKFHRSKLAASICAWIALLLSVYALGVADISDLGKSDIRLWVIAWCSVGAFSFLVPNGQRSSPTMPWTSTLLLAGVFWSLPLCYLCVRIVQTFSGVVEDPGTAAFMFTLFFSIALVVNFIFLSVVESRMNTKIHDLEIELAAAVNSARIDAQQSADMVQRLTYELESSQVALVKLTSEVERSRQVLIPFMSAKPKLDQLRCACAEIDELAALLKHRNEYDSFQPSEQESADLSITYFRTRIYNALELFGNRTRNILSDLETIMPKETKGTRSA